MSEYTLVVGDCIEAMREMADGSVDAIVTDPPYGIRFMGKRWDYDVPSVDAFAEMHRVLRDGGRLLCFAGSRTFHRMWCNIEDAGFTIEDTIMWLYGSGFPKHKSKLKPAFEPICVARKGGVSELNIDACRIGTERRTPASLSRNKTPNGIYRGGFGAGAPKELDPNLGRWPANVALDEDAARALDEQSGDVRSCGIYSPGGGGANTHKRRRVTSFGGKDVPATMYDDSGGASRFFYCAKADRAEREAGLEGATKQPGGSTAKGFTEDVERGLGRNRPVANNHPTVKPVALMGWLVRLVTQPGQVVLDPFTGSGTTGVACMQEGRNFVGIELNGEYAEIARKRIGNAPLSLFAQPDDAA